MSNDQDLVLYHKVTHNEASYFTKMDFCGSIIINPLPNKPLVSHVCSTNLLKTLWGKREIARNEQFLLFPQCFLPFWETSRHFHQV